MFCWNLAKIRLTIYYFLQNKKAKNSQIISLIEIWIKKGQMETLVEIKKGVRSWLVCFGDADVNMVVFLSSSLSGCVVCKVTFFTCIGLIYRVFFFTLNILKYTLYAKYPKIIAIRSAIFNIFILNLEYFSLQVYILICLHKLYITF